jgi:hypothetical protein
MTRWHRGALALLSIVGLAGAVTPALGEQAGPPPCTIRDDLDLHAGSEPTAEGHFPHEEWAANPSAQGVFQAFGSELAGRFGVDNEHDRVATLRRGLIGAALDHHAQQFVVVIDPGFADRGRLQEALERAATRGGKSKSFVRVMVGCNSAERLRDAESVIAARAWHPRAAEAPFGYGLDAHTSTYVATFNPEDSDVADALKARLGDLVTIEYGDLSRRGRMNDGEPHYGGAAIHPGNLSGNNCTSGFTVRLSNGNKGSVTANHCFRDSGDVNGRNVYSGSEYYGQTDGGSGFPEFDMVRIHPFGETYDNKIHVDPCCPDVRTVTGRGNPSVGEFLCVSGMVTKAVCGIEVTNINFNYCSGGCTPNTFVGKKPGELVGQGGDSGAPSYVRPTTTTAHIRGMEIGGTAFDNFVGHKVISIENHLNVSVSTG